MKTITVLRGLPSSGKTTYAKKTVLANPGTVRVNRDDIRTMLFGTKKDFSHDKETLVTRMEDSLVAEAIREGKSVIVDATHLRPKYITRWYRTSKELGVEFVVLEFPITLEEAIRRNQSREGEDVVEEDVLRNMASKFLPKGNFLPWSPPKDSEMKKDQYIPQEGLLKAVICDLDGTLALMNGRGPFDFDKVFGDEVNFPVQETLVALVAQGYTPIFMSGREDSCHYDTYRWLEDKAGFTRPLLLMRETGDKRKDSVIKKEMFDEYIRDWYHVNMVLDDRDQVVEMYRKVLNIPVFQVNYGNF